MNTRYAQTDDSLFYAIGAGAVRIAPGGGRWTLGPAEGPPLLDLRNALPLMPELADGEAIAGQVEIIEQAEPQQKGVRLLLRLHSASPDAGLVENELIILENRLIISGRYHARRGGALTGWKLAERGSGLSAETIHAYLGRHGAVDTTNGTVFAAGDADFTTASHNWTYAGSVPRAIVSRGGLNLGIGGTCIADDFGLVLRTRGGVVERLAFDCGVAAPRPFTAGEMIRSPRFQAQWTEGLSHDEAQAAFTQTLIDDGLVPAKHYPPEALPWRRPWYCTWADQMGITDAALTQEQAGQRDYQAIKAVLTQEMVLKVARFIRGRQLNIGTIIIDDGWQDYRGDWNLDTRKFPDMRGLVDTLHDMDFRVALWWAPFAVEEQAAVNQRPGFTTGPCPRYGQINMNYGRREVRDWAAAHWETWFSAGPGGWNIDGLKLDFLVDQIYAATHGAEVDARGEERLWWLLFSGLDAVIRRYKPFPGLLHVPYNPHFMPFAAAMHCEERFDRELSYLALRPGLCKALIPGTWYAPHFNYNPAIIPDYIREVKRTGGIVQVGKLISPDVTPELIGQMRDLLRDAG